MAAFVLRSTLVALLVLGSAGSSVVAKQKVTPVEKVIELLGNLQTELEAEAKAEAAQYDKFACFCKEQADEAVYEDEGHVKQIAELDATINKLDTDIKAVNKEIAALDLSIAALALEIKTEANQRAIDHDKYKAWAKELASAISALERAIAALKDSKSEMSDEVKLDLAQVRKAAVKLNQEPETYEFRSNDIIATLEGLRKTFLGKAKDHDQTEFDANAAWEKRDLDNNNEKSFQEADKAEKEKISAYKEELKSKAEAERDEEYAAKRTNEAYLKDVKDECQKKAVLWDQRSTMRAGEITAITDALALLNEKVNEQYGANKKLVGLQVAKSTGSMSFLQTVSLRNRLRGSSGNDVSIHDSVSGKAAARKAAAFLSTAAGSLGSKMLALASVRVTASEDHFVKVRSIIKDLIARLQDDADSEATQKNMCDKGMADGIKNRDNAQAEIEATSASISQSEAAKALAESKVAEISEQIAALKKALLEATELRDEEKADNEKTLATAREGHQGVQDAIDILRPFYATAENALVQLTTFSPLESAAGKDDKEYRDMAPEIFQDKYRGDQKASKGIIGLLEVIDSDFDRTITKVTADEAQAAKTFAGYKSGVDKLVALLDKEKTRQEGIVVALEKTLFGLDGDLKDEKDEKVSALDALSALEASCVDGEETYDERVAAREKEIEALKQAHQILEDWKGF